MTSSVGGLIADIGLDVANLREDIKASNNELRKGTNQMNRHLGSMQKAVRSVSNVFKGLAVAIAGTFIARQAKEAIDAADNMLKLTQRIGGTTEALSELEYVGDRSGVAFNTLTMGLQRMTRRISEAAGGAGEARGALKELGLDAKQLEKLPLDQQFEAIAEELSKITGESDRTRLAMRLFDSEGVALLQTMTRGAAGIRDMRREAHELGVTLSTEDAKAAAEAKDELVRLNATVEALSRDVTIGFVPALNDGAEALRKFIVGLQVAFDKRDAVQYEGQIRHLERELEFLQDRAEALGRLGWFDTQQFRDLQAEIGRVKTKIAELTRKQEIKLGFIADPDDAEKAIQGALEEIDVGVLTIDAGKFRIAHAEAFSREVEKNLLQIRPELPELTIETGSDRILRPEVHEDVELFTRKVVFARESVEKLVDIGPKLGLVFTSAFEDAALSGEGLRDVMRGLLQDIARIALRLSVTEPLSQFFSGIFGGGGGGLIDEIGVTPFRKAQLTGFAEGGSFRVGGGGGQDSQIVSFRASPDETVTISKPGQGMGGDIHINVKNYIDSRADSAQVALAIDRGMQTAVQQAEARLRREHTEGRFARARR